MLQENLLNSARIELQDTDEAIYTVDELIRAGEKSISQMSRLLPKRDLIEITLKSAFEQEAIPTSVYAGDTWIKTSTGAIYYAYAAGVSTIAEDGWVLDNTYTPMFKAANYMMLYIGRELASTDYIKIERVEFPVDQNPVNYPTFEMVGDYLLLRQKQTFTAGDKIRISYLKTWTPPTKTEEADYPTHLDNAVIIGLCGQALIFKAEKYVQDARTQADAITTLLDTISDLSLEAPELTVPTAPEISAPTAPDAYTFAKPTAPEIGAVPTAPVAPTLTFTILDAALENVDKATTGDMAVATAHLTSGAAYINAATRGENVGATYGNYANIAATIGSLRANKISGQINEHKLTLDKYQSQVNAFQNEVAAYATNLANSVGAFEQEVAAENAGAQVLGANVALYKAELDEQVLALNLFAQEVQNYAAQVSKWNADINAYTAQVQAILNEAQLREANSKNYLELAGRYLASGQAKINEFLTSLGHKPEFGTQRAASEQR